MDLPALLHSEDFRIEYCTNTHRAIQQALTACRDERRPYIILTDRMDVRPLRRVLVPVSMLEEETYKSEICTYLARTLNIGIDLLPAHDYGSRARQNTQRIVTHIHSVAEKTNTAIDYRLLEAHRDSFHLMREAVEHPSRPDMVILTASREYGLDDWLFGPQELQAIRHAHVPVMLVNPRADLFSLCN